MEGPSFDSARSLRDRASLGLLIAIVLFAAGLRVVGLGSLPRGLHPDEAANALEAWSLGHGLRSTDGRLLPLTFDHHGVDWVEGVYVWLAVPFVAVAGEHVELAVRLPAALAGTGAVLATFFLGARLAGTRAGLVAALLLAVEPWAVHHSRFAERAALEPLLVASGLAAALSGLDRKSARAVLVGGFILGPAVATYPPARVVVPLLAAALLVAAGASRREALLLLGPIVLAVAAIAPFALSERGLERIRAIGTLSPLEVLGGYGRHYLPRLYFSGDEGQGFLAKGMSPLLAVEAPLLIAGAFAAARTRRLRFLLAWLVLFPVASSFTQPAPNLLRAIFGLPLLALLGALGVEELIRRFGAGRVLFALAPLTAASVALSVYLYVSVFPAATSAWAPYATEREEVARMHGRVKVAKANERALVDLYARSRPHRWIAADEVLFED